jgi:orotate phosphoribosyltransferase
MTVAQKIAKILLETEAVKLSPEKPFTWSSGWKSPIYCDNRITLSDVQGRTLIKKALAAAIKKNFPEVDLVAGVATAGIAQGVLVADFLKIPFAYVRPKPKEHGMGNQIEGKIVKGQKVVVLEDLISTGGSSLKAVEALRAGGIEVIGMISVFTYGFKIADENFENSKVKLVVLSHYKFLIDEALKMNYIKDSDVDSLKKWRRNPAQWAI